MSTHTSSNLCGSVYYMTGSTRWKQKSKANFLFIFIAILKGFRVLFLIVNPPTCGREKKTERWRLVYYPRHRLDAAAQYLRVRWRFRSIIFEAEFVWEICDQCNRCRIPRKRTRFPGHLSKPALWFWVQSRMGDVAPLVGRPGSGRRLLFKRDGGRRGESSGQQGAIVFVWVFEKEFHSLSDRRARYKIAIASNFYRLQPSWSFRNSSGRLFDCDGSIHVRRPISRFRLSKYSVRWRILLLMGNLVAA